MKVILLFLLSFHCHAMTMSFDSISLIPGFDYNFILENTTTDEYYATLKCQNFFQKWDFYHQSQGLVQEHYITIRECELLFQNIIQCMETVGHKCVDLSDPFSQNCLCPSFKY